MRRLAWRPLGLGIALLAVALVVGVLPASPAEAQTPPLPTVGSLSLPSGESTLVEGVNYWYTVGLRSFETTPLGSGQTVTFNLTFGGSATRGTDYTLTCGTVTGVTCANLNTGNASITFTGPIAEFGVHNAFRLSAADDSISETGGETLSLTLGGRTWSGSIVDPPTSVTVGFTQASGSIPENRGPTEPTLLIDPAAGVDITVPLIMTGVTATAGTDFTVVSSVTVPAGRSRFSLAIPIIDDDLLEGDETFTVAIDTGNLPSIATAGSITTSTETIEDDDVPLVITVTGPASVTEGANAVFTVQASRAPSSNLTVRLTVSENKWYGTGNFVASSHEGNKTVTIPVAQTSATYTVPTVDDSTDEPDNSMFLTVKPGSGYTVGSPSSATVEVQDNDHTWRDDLSFYAPPVVNVQLNQNRTDGLGGKATRQWACVRIHLTNAHLVPRGTWVHTVAYWRDSNGRDLGLGMNWFAYGQPAWSHNHCMWVSVEDDAGKHFNLHITRSYINERGSRRVPRNTDVVRVNLLAPVGHALYEEPTVRFRRAASSVREADKVVRVGVVLTKPAAEETVVRWHALSTGTATLGTDYILRRTLPGLPGTGEVTFKKNEQSKHIYVRIIDDDVEDSGETVNLQLTNVIVRGVNRYQDLLGTRVMHTLTILNHETVPEGEEADVVPEVSIAGGNAVAEGGKATFTLTASPPPESPIEVKVAVTQRGAFAANGEIATRTVSVGTGGTASFTVATVDDAADEPDGSVTATLAAGQDYVVHGSDSAATVRVADNDPPSGTPVVSVAGGPAVTEGSNAGFVLSASPRPKSPIQVRVTVTQSGAFAASGEIATRTVSVGTDGTAVFTVATVDDGVVEADGSVTATLATGQDYAVHKTGKAATVAVSDNDAAPLAAKAEVLDNGDVRVGWPDYASSPKVHVRARSSDGHGTEWCHDVAGNWCVLEGLKPGTWIIQVMKPDLATVLSPWVILKVPEEGDLPDAPPKTATPVVSIAAGSGVTEGGAATFTVTANPKPTSPLSVSLSVSQSGDYAASGTTGTKTVTVSTSGSATYSVATVDDSTDEADGSITVSLSNGQGYTVGSSSSATVSVSDNDNPPVQTPEVSITGGSGITEGGNASFTLTASPQPTSPLTVSLSVSQSGDYAASGTTGTKTVTVPTSGSVTYTVATVDDGSDEADGSISASLSGGQGYTVGSASSATVTVKDDDDDAPAGTGAALPGTVAAAVTNGVVQVARPSGWTGSGKIQFGGGAKARDRGSFTDLRIAKVDADGFEVSWASRTPGTLRLTLEWQPVAGSSWQPSDGGPQDPRVLTIEDPGTDPQPAQTPAPTPEVSITAGSGITEGGTATFTVTASPQPTSPLSVSLSVSQSGDYAASGTTGSKSVTIPTSGSATYSVATVDDSTDEADGSVTVSLSNGQGYTVGSSSSATVSVSDNDDPAPATPTVSITGGSGITEGGTATFTVTASPQPTSPLTVSLSVSQSGDYAASGTTGSKSVTIPTSGSATYSVATVDDGSDETDGSVTVSLSNGQGYTVGSSSSATVSVSDNDDPAPVTPTVIITGGSGITEGGTATFTVTASPQPTSPLTVSLSVSQSGDYAAAGTTGSKSVTIPTSGSVTYSVATVDDSNDEPTGSITVSLSNGQDYTVGSSSSARVWVSDDDAPPYTGGVTLSVDDPSARESDGELIFTVRLSEESHKPVWVDYIFTPDGTATDGEDYNAVEGHLLFRPFETEKQIRVNIYRDEDEEGSETVVLRLLDPDGAGIAKAEGTGTILD